jgi:hypothetical protein
MERDTSTTRIRPKSAEAQRHHDEVFVPQIRSIRAEIERTPLSVLVWGPGENGDLYEQRVKIVNVLRDANINADMSEAVVTNDDQWSIRDQEFMQALAADMIVILCASPGSIAELADFSSNPELAAKMVVFLDSRHKGSYIALGPATSAAVFGNVLYYDTPDDLISDVLCTHVLKVIRKYQLAKWYRSKMGAVR